MLEKDIENLIARFPDDFLPYNNLKLIGQQVKLGTYFADIIFEDSEENKIIIEIKRGILSREAVAQIMDYYGIITMHEKNMKIKLILVANIIPKERVIFLSQKLGIEFIEISPIKILESARNHSYKLLDESEDAKSLYTKKAQEIDGNVISGKSNIWIFQANPLRFDILNALADEKMTEDTWLVSRYKDMIRVGDTGIVWMSGIDSGIYALAEVISNPDYIPEPEYSRQYWMSGEDMDKIALRVRLKYTLKLVNNPVLRNQLKNIPELKELSILKQAQGTNFQVSQEEWNTISRIIKEKIK